MTQQTFEKQFPELIKEFCKVNKKSFRCRAIFPDEIEKYCLSKQRVKEAIEKHRNTTIIGITSTQAGVTIKTNSIDREDLLKELGLEDK